MTMCKRKRFVSLLLCALFLPILLLKPSAAQAETPSGDDRLIVVSLGDSYSSGEGNEPFYGRDRENDSFINADWLAHRSIYAWPALLSFPELSGAMAIYRNVNWYFAAASGATTEEIRRTGDRIIDSRTGQREGTQSKPVNRDGVIGEWFLYGQLDVFYNTPGLDRNDVDYVTITIGGNDVNFATIVGDAAFNCVWDRGMYKEIQEKLDHFYDGTENIGGQVSVQENSDKVGTYVLIHDAYKRIHEAAPNATILVAGYPELMDDTGDSLLFRQEDREYINKAVRIFNNRIEGIVKDCQREGIPIVFCPVIDEFRGHGAYAEDPYINPIIFGPVLPSQDLKGIGLYSNYSMHPNYEGQRAYARCVQRKINELAGGQIEATAPVRETSEERDVVLVLDTSESMYGTPMQETKKAAESFIRTVLKEDASIGIVTYAYEAYRQSDFSKNESYLTNTVKSIEAYGRTNTYDGLRVAEEMLDDSTAKKKFIVLMSDGLPNEGKTGNALLEYVERLKEKGILIYTLGFFQNLYSSELRSAQRLMEGIASDACHFEVADADHLVFFFEDIADQIRGTPYIYIRIACPVDVRVEYQGEILSSTGSTRTSFGTVTFEENQGERSYGSSDDRTKVLRLKEGADYKIEITGNGEGTMDYTVGFVDENGEYSDLRKVEDVNVTRSSVMESNALRDKRTVLRVDDDGDGRTDRTIDLGGPEQPKEEKKAMPWWAWVLIGVGGAALIGAAVLLIVLHGKKKNAPDETPPRTSGPVGSGTAPRFCPKCGRPYEGSIRFCMGCGTELKGSETAAKKPLSAAEPMTRGERTDGTAAEKPYRSGMTVRITIPAEEKPSGGLKSTMRTKQPVEPKPAPTSEAPVEPKPRPLGSAKFCLRCGAPIDEDSKFCLNCGEPVEPKPAAEPESGKEPEPAPVEPEPVNEPEPAPTSEAPVEPKPRPSGRPKFCLRCGAPVDEDSKFCLNCGEEL